MSSLGSHRSPVTVTWAGATGLRIVGDDWGGTGRPVLLLHGGGQTRHSWRGTAETLAVGGLRPIALDLRGHGDSDWDPGGDYSLDAFVADLCAVCAALPSGPVLIGASLGGMTALAAVGERVVPSASALVLVDVTPRLEVGGTERIRAFMTARPDGFASLDEVAEAVAAYLPGRPRPRDTAGLARNVRLGADGRYRWHWDPRFIGTGRPDLVLGERPAAAARAVRVPTLLVRGRLSDVVSEEGAAEFLDLIPHARYADVEGAGHMVAGDRNDAFTSAILGFLDEVR